MAQRINDQRRHLSAWPIREIVEFGDMHRAVLLLALLKIGRILAANNPRAKLECVALNTEIATFAGWPTGPKSDLARAASGPRLRDKRINQRRIKIKVVPINKQLTVARKGLRRKFLNRVNFGAALAMALEQITLEQPKRFVQEPQIAGRLEKGGDFRSIADYYPFHCKLLSTNQAGGSGATP